HESHINEKEIAAKNIALQREIEDRKRAEMEGARLATRLQHAEKMEAMGTLAGGVAHDLNNILSAIVGYPELLLLEIPEDSPYRSAILNIKKSGEKAGAIVQDLLNLARRAVLDMNVVNLEKIIEEYLISPECKKLLQYHPNVEIVTHFEDELLPISGSPVHLSKAIMNLVSNAAEAMPEGGTITVSISNTLINAAFARFASIAKGDYLKLKVSDTGTGIPQKDIENIFQPFYTKKIMGRSGTGLGMTVVWGTVKDHNGYIDVQSTEGKGTIFSLYLPATEESVTELKQHHNLEDYIGHGEKILIVDDMPAQRDIAKMMLEKLGYDATTVSSGDEAVTYISNNAVEVVLLDMLMAPGIDGLETYQQIKAIHPKQKAVIASGFSETNRVKAAIELGANGYVRKPYTLETIGIAVHRALDSN
ncbi:MAG: response regulator, partial [Desulforhopalus sp.]|nr:response regulator [Desulforhopalus sp.]